MSHKRHTPNQAAVKASNQHTTLTSHRTLCHRGTKQKHKGAAPTTGTTWSIYYMLAMKEFLQKEFIFLNQTTTKQQFG